MVRMSLGSHRKYFLDERTGNSVHHVVLNFHVMASNLQTLRNSRSLEEIDLVYGRIFLHDDPDVSGNLK